MSSGPGAALISALIKANSNITKKPSAPQLEQTNQNYIKSRHKERVVTMDEWRKKTMHAPEEQILQIGRMEQYPEVEVFLSYFEEYLTLLNKWNEEHGKPFSF